MNFINKIKEFFYRRAALNEIYDDINNLDVVLLEKRIEIFNELITPRFAEIGLNNWDGKYVWYSDFNNEGIRHVIKYEVFRYFGGSFSYGNCYDFIPTFNNKNELKYHKSKSNIIIVDRKILEGWQEDNKINYSKKPYKISTVNEDKFRKSIFSVLDYNISIIDNWFKDNDTKEKNLKNLLYKIDNPEFQLEHTQKAISEDYIASFIYASKNDFNKSLKYMQEHFKKKLLRVDIEKQKIELKQKFQFLDKL